jgi:hypothetical protein
MQECQWNGRAGANNVLMIQMADVAGKLIFPITIHSDYKQIVFNLWMSSAQCVSLSMAFATRSKHLTQISEQSTLTLFHLTHFKMFLIYFFFTCFTTHSIPSCNPSPVLAVRQSKTWLDTISVFQDSNSFWDHKSRNKLGCNDHGISYTAFILYITYTQMQTIQWFLQV